MSAPQPSETVYVTPQLTQRTPEERTKLQTKQMITFFGLGAITIATAVFGKKSVTNRKFVPLLFDSNNNPPSFSLVRDAATAVVIASTLAVSTVSFATFGVAWLTGASTIRDFSITMKKVWGAAKKEEEYLNAPVDRETEEFGRGIQNFLGGAK